MKNHVLTAALAALAVLAACGDSGSDSDTGGGGADDGKVRPPGNGTPVDEAASCSRLHDALNDQGLEMQCVTTFRTCPSLVQSLTSETCAAYDDGSLDGCLSYYAEATDCDDLKARADNCVPETVGSPPDGCPE